MGDKEKEFKEIINKAKNCKGFLSCNCQSDILMCNTENVENQRSCGKDSKRRQESVDYKHLATDRN